jgi:putative transposase
MMTFPSTPRGKAKVQPGLGVKINYIYYWSDEMRNPKMEMQKVPVRFDPYNLAVAYAYLNGRWVKCVSSTPEVFEGRSQKELLLATTKLRQMNRNVARNQAITASALAELFQAAYTEERLRKQKLRDAARKGVHVAKADVPSNSEYSI